jgi:hypothetical protein
VTEKVIDGAKQISLKAASAACRAATSLGAADALLIAGIGLLLASQWVRGKIKSEDHLEA